MDRHIGLNKWRANSSPLNRISFYNEDINFSSFNLLGCNHTLFPSGWTILRSQQCTRVLIFPYPQQLIFGVFYNSQPKAWGDISIGRGKSLQQMELGKQDMQMQKNETELYLTSYTKTNSKRIRDLNIRPRM